MKVNFSRRGVVSFVLCGATLIGLWLYSHHARYRRASSGAEVSSMSVAFRDPKTGAFSAPPAGGAPEVRGDRLKAAFATVEGGLVESKATSPAGGVRVQLQGRYVSYVVARKEPSGKLVLDCSAGPESPESARAAGKEKK